MADDILTGSESSDTLGGSSGGLNLGDLVSKIGGVLLTGGQTLLGSSSIGDQKDTLNAGLGNAAHTLDTAYDTRQGITETGIDELIKLLTSGLSTTSGIYQNAASTYGNQMGNTVSSYSSAVQPLIAQLTKGLSGASDLYGAQMDNTEGQSQNELEKGVQDVQDKFAPYEAQGQDAMGYFAQVMGLDPNQLTPDQKIMMSDLTRDLNANLAASGLRGAGRSGVAATDDALARAKAQAFDANQKRRDDAAKLLEGQGYTATGTVANALNDTQQKIANLKYQTGTATANNSFNTNSAIANTAFATGQDVANKGYSTGQDVAKTNLGINEGVGNLTSQYYQNLGNLTSDRYNARGDTVMGKAQVDSTTGLDTSKNNATAQAKDTSLYSSALEKIGTLLTANKSAAAKTI